MRATRASVTTVTPVVNAVQRFRDPRLIPSLS